MWSFTNRELATAAWAAVALIGSLSFSGVRSSLLAVLKGLLNWKILAATAVMGLWVGGVVWLLEAIGIWTPRLLKDTAAWFIFSAIMTGYGSLAEAGSADLRRVLLGNISIVIGLEFIAHLRSFPLAFELLLVPVTGVFGATTAYLKAKDQTDSRLYGVGQTVLGVIGIGVLAYSVVTVGNESGALSWIAMAREFALEPLLLLGFLPCIYLLVLAAAYEKLMLQVELWLGAEAELVRYAKGRVVRKLGFSLNSVQSFLESTGTAIPSFRTRKEVDEWLANSK